MYVSEHRRVGKFKGMIQVTDAKLSVPNCKLLKKSLLVQKELATSKMNHNITGKFYLLTLNHWMSAATTNENYDAALMLHQIDNVEMNSMVLYCVKHSGGSSTTKMDEQLAVDMMSRGLEEKCFVAL